jgi:sulfur-carrier protein adenylyltransferase/sulfurtransferase
MHDELLGSGSEFDRASAVLGLILRRQRSGCRPLNRDELETYRLRRFVVGWVYTRNIADVDYEFRVLLDEDFPRSRIRVAIAEDYYLRWPHVEKQGVLCLPLLVAPLAAVEAVLLRTLDDAEKLVNSCATDPAFVESEFTREFLSYWQWSVKDITNAVWSLRVCPRTSGWIA